MNILVIADPIIPIPPSHYGGAERIVALTAEAFRQDGHRVHLMAGAGSMAYGGRLHLHRAPTAAYSSRAYRKLRFQLQSIWAARDCDVVYNSGRSDYLEALLALRKPLLHCFHNPIDQGQIDRLEGRIRSQVVLQCVSESQRSQATQHSPTVVIPNPIDCRAYEPGAGAGGYLAFLGRLTFNKGVDVAIAVAKRTGRKLVIAGNVSTEEGAQEFFRTQVEPHLDGEQIRWIGPVNDRQKRDLLAEAEALLFPIRWDEPFGIVMVEALACGCPVIATRRASVPEVIEHGRTGFICDPAEPSAAAFSEAVARLPELSRQTCRQAAEHRFDVTVVVPRIVQVLEQLVNGSIQ